jgi:N-hydroxyarylamine O-acetyltransferase
MNDLNTLFRKRIGFLGNETITFEKLDLILEKTANSIPFENLCIITKSTIEFTKENVMNKILIRNEGGLCYDLNVILYLFLLENGFKVTLIRGVIFNFATQDWSPTGRTHVAIVLKHKDQQYLIDTGFGGNLPLKPISLSGETITSNNGEFQVGKVTNRFGDFSFKMKLKNKDLDWKIGYVFDTSRPIKSLSEINDIQKIICTHQHSPFNKTRLLTRFTTEGNVTLTDTSFTQSIHGKIMKEKIDPNRFNELAKRSFGINCS